MGLKIILAALLNLTMEQPISKFNALPKLLLIPTEIQHFEWRRVYAGAIIVFLNK